MPRTLELPLPNDARRVLGGMPSDRRPGWHKVVYFGSERAAVDQLVIAGVPASWRALPAEEKRVLANTVYAALDKKPGPVGRIRRWWFLRSTPREVVARYDALVFGFRAMILDFVEHDDAEYQEAYSKAVSEAVTLDLDAIRAPGSKGLKTKEDWGAWLRSL